MPGSGAARLLDDNRLVLAGKFAALGNLKALAVVKPIPTLLIALRSVDLATKEPQKASVERSDTCVVPAAGVVAEAMLALVLADALLEKTGGDSMDEVRRNLDAFLAAQRSL